MNFSYGSPFVHENSGRVKTDCQNERNIQRILDNFIGSPLANPTQFRWSVTKETADLSKIACPAIGFAVGLAGSLSFVHPNSKYIGKFFTLFTTYLGWKCSLRLNEHYNYSKRVANFHLYPRDIQRTLDNNDYRYARKWLNPEALIQKLEEVTPKDTLPESTSAEAGIVPEAAPAEVPAAEEEE